MRTRLELDEAFEARARLGAARSLFLVGIGGAGMRGLVPLALLAGLQVAGSDAEPGPEALALGVPVRAGHSGELPAGVDALVLSDAIDLGSSPEVAAARARGIPVFRRSQLLGWLLRDRRVVAVAGSHGKTTTTGLLGSGLIAAGLDPTVVVGASTPDFGGPTRVGRGEWAVVEACEAYDGLRDLDPELVLLTNLELDHADFHGTMEALEETMLAFVRRGRKLFFAAEDPGARRIAELAGLPAEGYAEDETLAPRLFGRLNRLDASGAAAVARELAPERATAARRGIEEFGGAERRLQIVADGEATIVDDYAHHPTEIAASIAALRERYPGRRLVVAFQPHLYSRTRDLMDGFATALSAADLVVLTDIYPAREAPIPGVGSAVLAERVAAPTTYVASRFRLPDAVRRLLMPGDVVVGMGAGTIAEFAPALAAELSRRPLGGATRPLSVAVLHAGDSSEREVSILSGREILEALRRRGHEARLVDVADLVLRRADLRELVGPERPDLAFLAVHGTHAEDGAIQGLLELLGIPYTGSGIQASAIAMDKAMTKRILAADGFRVPLSATADSSVATPDFPPPYVVKPNAEGSTVGVGFVREADGLRPALERALRYGAPALIEEWIEGVEVSVPVLDGEALPPVEIVPREGVYDFANKYTPGATDEIVPARLPESVLERCRQAALRAHALLGCEGATRSDLIVRDGEPVFLELNTLPGMTATSLLPRSAAAAGIPFDELCERLVRDALRRHGS